MAANFYDYNTNSGTSGTFTFKNCTINGIPVPLNSWGNQWQWFPVQWDAWSINTIAPGPPPPSTCPRYPPRFYDEGDMPGPYRCQCGRGTMQCVDSNSGIRRKWMFHCTQCNRRENRGPNRKPNRGRR